MRNGERFDAAADVFGDVVRTVFIGVGQNNRKLFAAVTSDHVAGPARRAADRTGNRLQAVITGQVAADIVKILEAIGVHEGDRKTRVVAAMPAPLFFHRSIELPSIGNSGQTVSGSQLLQARVGLLQLPIRSFLFSN